MTEMADRLKRFHVVTDEDGVYASGVAFPNGRVAIQSHGGDPYNEFAAVDQWNSMEELRDTAIRPSQSIEYEDEV